MQALEPLPSKITIGEKYGPAMSVKTREEAAAMFERLVAHNMSQGHTREQAVNIEKQNLGYYAGYYDLETQRRVQELYGAVHPFYGSVNA